MIGDTRNRMVPPLVQELERQGYRFPLARGSSDASSTRAASLGSIKDALYFWRHNDRENARQSIVKWLERVAASSTGIVAHDWTNQPGGVRTFSEGLHLRIRQEFHLDFILKTPGRDIASFVETVSSEVYAARSHGVPPCEVLASAGEFVLSLYAGENSAYEFLQREPEQSLEHARRAIESTQRLANFAEGNRHIMRHARNEDFSRKYAERWQYMTQFLPSDIGAFIRRHAAADVWMRKGRRQPNVDAAMVNINVQDGKLWHIDIERMRLLVPEGYQYAHVIWDPSLALSFDERLELQAPYGLAEAWEYLSRKPGYWMQNGTTARYAHWAPIARERFFGYCDLLQQLAAVPEVKHRFRMAQVAAEIDFRSLPLEVRCSGIKGEGPW